MQKFELCFNIVGSDTYIIPELLPPERPAVDFNRYHTADALHFQYKYEFMPGGIISRFISRVYYLVEAEHFWKNGVELRFEQASALVLSQPLDRKITISVRGQGKSDLLAIIRNDLGHIHSTLNMETGVHFQEMVPCKCAECLDVEAPFYFKYKVLKKFLQKSSPAICQASADEVSISRLLHGVEPERPLKQLDLTEALTDAAHYLQGIAKSIQPLEDSRNDFITALLTSKGLIVRDQTRWGVSAAGKTIGRPDFKVVNPETGQEAVVEALNLDSLKKEYVDLHVKKLFNYDANGLERNFILVYCDAADCYKLWQKYGEYIPRIAYEHELTGFEILDTRYADIKMARATHSRSGKETDVFHLFIKMAFRPVT
jgi:hypothetical protein